MKTLLLFLIGVGTGTGRGTGAGTGTDKEAGAGAGGTGAGSETDKGAGTVRGELALPEACKAVAKLLFPFMIELEPVALGLVVLVEVVLV